MAIPEARPVQEDVSYVVEEFKLLRKQRDVMLHALKEARVAHAMRMFDEGTLSAIDRAIEIGADV